MNMKYYLAKTDPETYSISDLKNDKETVWDGVHNFQAILVIKNWEIGDMVLIYHSQGEGRIVGLAEVIGEPYENKNDPRKSWVAKIKFHKEFDENDKVTLKEIKESGLFKDFLLVRNPRLSTMECPEKFISWLLDKIKS